MLRAICREEYGRTLPRLNRLLADVADLYAGRWPSHEACEVAYHDFAHALDAAVAVARMAAGWNRAQPGEKLSPELFCCAVAAGLFHDAGYIKDKGDHEGHGGKFTATHVQRGMALAASYLQRTHWSKRATELVPATIALTDYHQEPQLDDFFVTPGEVAVARMIPTADLIAQIADNRYIEKLDGLFAEFKEMYEYQERRKVENGTTPVFSSAQEIRDGVKEFYNQFVAPRLEKFGRMDRYLTVYFGENRNPYHENITANLSSHLLGPELTWQLLGKILVNRGLIDHGQLSATLEKQQRLRRSRQHSFKPDHHKASLLTWLGQRSGDNLGDILLEMNAASPSVLADSLVDQSLPPVLLDSLTQQELRLLLKFSLLVQQLPKSPWLLTRIMELINNLMNCEAGSLMLAAPRSEIMLIAVPTGPCGPALRGRQVPVDKGLAGWVYRNAKPAMAANVLADQRFDRTVDSDLNFTTRSLLAVPLIINGGCLGVVEAVNKSGDTFNQHDLHKLTILANMLAAAFEIAITGITPPAARAAAGSDNGSGSCGKINPAGP